VVAAECDSSNKNGRFLIRPDCSLTTRGMLVFFAGICTLSLAVAAGLSLLGAWPILPFAGLEMLALAVCLYQLSRRSQDCEVISVRDRIVEVDKHRRGRSRRYRFERVWARVALSRDPRGWYPSRLTIRSHGHEVEVGRCLNEHDRTWLARDLSRLIAV
jgi:uncharacterized membrane protein